MGEPPRRRSWFSGRRDVRDTGSDRRDRSGRDRPPSEAALVDGAEGRIEVGAGIALWYLIVGDGAEVVLVPTTGNHVDLDALASPDRTLVFYDVRGRGRSDAVPAAEAGFAAEVADLDRMGRAFGLERFSVVGTSYHAGVAAAFAVEHPDRIRRLVLVAPIPVHAGARPVPARQPAPHQVAHLDQLEAAGLRVRDPAALCRAWREVYVPLLMGRPDAFERLAPVCDLPNERPWVVASSLVHVFADLISYDWRPSLREVTAPTLVVHGSEDHEPIEHAVEWVDALGAGRLLELDGIGQLPWVEAPGRFFAAVGRFLDGELI